MNERFTKDLIRRSELRFSISMSQARDPQRMSDLKVTIHFPSFSSRDRRVGSRTRELGPGTPGYIQRVYTRQVRRTLCQYVIRH